MNIMRKQLAMRHHWKKQSKMLHCSRISIFTLSQNRKIPELKIAISRMSFLLSLYFPEFEIVQNVIFPKMAFYPKMSFCTRTPQYHISHFVGRPTGFTEYSSFSGVNRKADKGV